MNKKEVAEIRRQYVPERCTISRICGCYVDAEKNIKTTMKEAFLSLPEDDAFKYFTIFKKTLSGTVGRNLVNLDFPLEEEHEGGHQEFLLKLRNSKLKDDALVEEFYNRIIDTFPFGENYYIILIHVAYDVPGKATDGTEMYDASDNVFEYLLCSFWLHYSQVQVWTDALDRDCITGIQIHCQKRHTSRYRPLLFQVHHRLHGSG